MGSLDYISSGGTKPAQSPISYSAPSKTVGTWYIPATGNVEQQLYAGSNVYVPISNTPGSAPGSEPHTAPTGQNDGGAITDGTGGQVLNSSTKAYYGAGGTAKNAQGYTADAQRQVIYHRTLANQKVGQLDTLYGNTL